MKKLLFTIVTLTMLLAGCGSVKLTSVSRPTFDKHYTSKSVTDALSQQPPRTVTFKLAEEKTDSLPFAESCKAWFADNGVNIKAMTYHDGFEMVPLRNMRVESAWISKYKTHATKEKTYHLSHVVEQDHVVLFFYGDIPNEFRVINNVSLLVVRDKLSEKVKMALNFKEFAYSPDFVENVKDYVYQDLLWAYVDMDRLYVSHAHWTYSSTTKEQNGYITAISLKDKKILWRTAPKVANAINFVVAGDMLLSAYGYTREGAKVFAIDKNTGKIAGELTLAPERSGKKHIEYIYNKGNTVYLKAFDNTAYKVSY